jgi:hypothetical protein
MLRLTTLALACAAALLTAGTASAGNWKDNRLNAVASHIAGKPVDVHCEDSWYVWINSGEVQAEDWSLLAGYTYLSEPVVYIAPDRCETLHALLEIGPRGVGAYHAAGAVQTLVHEAVHQRGVTDEGETDCTALSLVDEVAVRHFGYKRTERVPYTVTTTSRRKVDGRWIRTQSKAVRYRMVPSQALKDFHTMAVAWHEWAPPEYQGTC